MNKKNLRSFWVVLAAAWLTACAGTSVDETQSWSASRLYDKAAQASARGDYENAIKDYAEIIKRFPFSRYAQQAQLDMAYTHYEQNEPDLALAEADHFIKLYPRHAQVDYAYYLKGLINFKRGAGFLDELLNMDPARRDPRAARDAQQIFTQLLQQFPNSRYAEDAAQRLIYLNQRLMRYELIVAQYYFGRSAYVAAANRAKYALENYPTSPATPDLLTVMAQSYEKLGLHDLAHDAWRVLGHNYPAEKNSERVKR